MENLSSMEYANQVPTVGPHGNDGINTPMTIKERASDGLSVDDFDSDQSQEKAQPEEQFTQSHSSLVGLEKIDEVKLDTESDRPELSRLSVSDITKTETKRYDTQRRG